MTVRELSAVLPFCRFFHFLIYNSVRFVYISFTFSFTLFFLFSLAWIHALDILVRHACHLWHLIDFISFFLAKTLAKTCQRFHQNGKSLILKEFLFVKCVMSLSYSTLSLIIITSYCLCAAYLCASARSCAACSCAAYLCAAYLCASTRLCDANIRTFNTI